MSIARAHAPRLISLTCRARQVSYLVKPWLRPTLKRSVDDEADVRAIQEALDASGKPPILKPPQKTKIAQLDELRAKLHRLVQDYNTDSDSAASSEELSPDAIDLYPQDVYLSRMQALGAKPEEDAPLLKIAPLPEELQTANVSAETKKMQALSDKARSKEKKERNRTQKLKPRREFVETQEDAFMDVVLGDRRE